MEMAWWLGFGWRWRTTVAVCSGFRDQKIGYREEDILQWFRMVAGTRRRPEMDDDRNWKTAGDGRQQELEERRSWPKMENDDGRRWRTTVAGRAWRMPVAGRAWWSTVGRKWVDGEREGKFGGKLGEQKWENGVLL
jgi:hypothetical protein